MEWHFEKFQGDGAIYGICPKCNFHHMVNDINRRDEVVRCYNYCPVCGEHLYGESDEVAVIWNERDILELYNEKQE